ncbi:hypothetical protein ISCGN_015746 [Ixodes scapularis]
MLFARLASRPTVPELDLGSKKTTQWIPTRQPPPPSESWSGSAGPTVIEPHADDGSFDTYDGKEENHTNTKEHTTDKQSVVEDSQSDLGSTAYKSKATGPTPPVHSTQQAPEVDWAVFSEASSFHGPPDYGGLSIRCTKASCLTARPAQLSILLLHST